MVHASSNILFTDLEGITKGRTLQLFSNKPILSIAVDSRKTIATDGLLFFAISGSRHNGHLYIEALYQLGVRQFVVENDSIDLRNLSEANVLLVPSTVRAMQRIVAHHRSQFTIPVIGITGSNGKTIVKEWLSQMLSADFSISKNPGSYNSQVGVPLAVWSLQNHHELGIFEAGISKPDEMNYLAEVIQPTIGIFTNIGTAHNEGFQSVQEKIQEKLALFKHTSTIIYCSDHAELHHAISSGSYKSFTWGSSKDADIIVSYSSSGVILQHQENKFSLQLPFRDKASIENCMQGVALMVLLGYTEEQIQERVRMLHHVPMRLELKEGINQCQIIDDTYNNDLSGLEISLQFLTHQQQKNTKRLILSDMLQSGLSDDALVSSIKTLIEKNNITEFVGIGPVLYNYVHVLPSTAQCFPSTQAFLENFNFDSLHQEIILVKGARSFAFERIVNRLQRRVHGTVMEIDLNTLVDNLNFFKTKVSSTTKIMTMVKAFAYGSGSIEIANVLQYNNIDYLGVAYADEGVELRKNNITLPIMVMNPSEESFPSLITHTLEPEIYSFKILHALLQFLNGAACTIHLKIDTGMHRLGFEESDLPTLVDLLKVNTHLRISSIFSHLSGADDKTHDAFTKQQAATFKSCADFISNAIGYRPLYHLLNTSGILRTPEFEFDMVRLGIGLYGVDPTQLNFQLKPVATLKTIISQIKQIKKGDTIGYGRKGIAHAPMRIATLAIGYADGYSRAFSQGIGEVLIADQRAPVIGNVCMDMTMVDITNIAAQEGDEVIVFGKELPIQELAQKINTIPYEILTNTSERVKRVFVASSI